MTTRAKIRRRKRPTRAYLQGLAQARLDLIFRHALEQQHYGLALEAVKAQARMAGLKIDGPIQPGAGPSLCPEAWQKLLHDAERRRDS